MTLGGLEAGFRAALDGAGVRWERPEAFEVRLADRRVVRYRPNLLLPEARVGGKPVVVDVMEVASPWGGIRRLIAFRREWGDRYHLVVVAPASIAAELPPESYNTLIAGPEFAGLDRQLELWKAST